MKLFNSPISPNGRRVRICAAELGLELESVTLDFRRGDNHTPEYLALNPMGKIPTLDDSGFVLWESAAILCYLAQQHGAGLWPRETRAQADLLRWLFFCSCHLDPYFTTLVVERFIKARQNLAADEAQTASAEQWLARFVPVVEQQVTRHDYVTGIFSVADIALGCTLELSDLLKYDLTPYPSVRAWLERLQARASWRAASTA
jgi:glutathione S-transferase